MPVLDSLPMLKPQSRWFWQAFTALSAKRQIVSGQHQPIAMAEIAAYADYFDLTVETLKDDLFYMVSLLDATYLQLVNGRKARGNSKTPTRRIGPAKGRR